MIRRSRIRVAVFTILVLTAVNARSDVLGIFADQAGTNCNITAPLGVVTYCYLVLQDPTVETAAGIELAVRGLPSGWMGWIDVCPPCAIVLSSGFGDGATLALMQCVSGDPLLIAPVVLVAATDARDVILEVGAKRPPSNPDHNCPQIIQCDAPVFTSVCVQGGRSRVNGTRPCTVAVAPVSWSALKSLYE